MNMPLTMPVPTLKDGDRMSRDEFERRYAAMPESIKADPNMPRSLLDWRASRNDRLTPPGAAAFGRPGRRNRRASHRRKRRSR